MDGSRLLDGLKIHLVKSNRDKQALFSFIVGSALKIDKLISKIFLLILALIIGLILVLLSKEKDINYYLNFVNLFREPAVFLSSIFNWKLAVGIVSFFFPIIVGALFGFLDIYTGKYKRSWVATYDQKFVAYAETTYRSTYSVLHSLFVADAYQRRGIGTALIKHLVRHSTGPLYVLICPNFMGGDDPRQFYVQLGFQSIRESEIPHEVADHLRNLGATALVLYS